MCGRNNNFITINFEIHVTYLQMWHDHKKYIKMSFLGDKHTYIYVKNLDVSNFVDIYSIGEKL